MKAKPLTAQTPMAFVHGHGEAYERRGIDPSRALKLAQIAPDQVHKRQARITAAQMEAVSDAAMRELDDEALGCFSRALPWGSYGMLARASLSAPTLGLALKRWCRHHALAHRRHRASVFTATTADGAPPASNCAPSHTGRQPSEFCVVSVLRNILGFACWLVDSRIPLLGAQFPFEAPEPCGVVPGPVRWPQHLRPRPRRPGVRRPLPRPAHPARRSRHEPDAATRAAAHRARLPPRPPAGAARAPGTQHPARSTAATPTIWRPCSTCHRAACTANCRTKAPRCRRSKIRCAGAARWRSCSAASGPSNRWRRRWAFAMRRALFARSKAGRG